MSDHDARLSALETAAATARRESDAVHAATSAEIARIDERLSAIHEMTADRMRDAREERAERKRVDARLFAELRKLGEQVAALAPKVAALETAAEVEEKTDAKIEALSTKRREAIKGWVGIIGGLMAAGLSAWGLLKLFGHVIAEAFKAKP